MNSHYHYSNANFAAQYLQFDKKLHSSKLLQNKFVATFIQFSLDSETYT